MRKPLLLVPVGLVVLLAGGGLLYTKVIAADPPERLTFATPTAAPGWPATSSATASAPSTEGTWRVTAPSEAGYRPRRSCSARASPQLAAPRR